MATVSFVEARRCVAERLRAAVPVPRREAVSLVDSNGRVLAEPIIADRDFPPAARSTRDGYAVRSSDVPGMLRITGEVRAGERPGRGVGAGEALEIMTGAVVPEGADAVVMVEHVIAHNGEVRMEKAAPPGSYINARGTEALAGEELLSPGDVVSYASVALMASVGCIRVMVYRRPSVAILATGDEIVELNEQPAAHQVRNSNAYALAAQVARAGGVPRILPVVRDTLEATCAAIERGLAEDLLLLSGGVSAGKYDVVERALASFGAEFFFDRVLIQPGQPLVFGRLGGKFFFGLPGNPASTMLTFELFARTALELLGGRKESLLPFTFAPLAEDFRHSMGLTRFLPARLNADGSLSPVRWQGSSDMVALSRANAFLVADADRAEWKQGEQIRVLLK
ncbi:MAG: molybdopterin molybdotransferase MoeA [Acidobacteria bacterium]|nr:molybdopterin molybdotransferase MoeA [Acidobacteriota bacterium]